MASREYEVAFSRRAAKARSLAGNAGEKIPENIVKAIVSVRSIEELTPEQVPQFLIDWIERMEETYLYNVETVPPVAEPGELVRKHKTIFTFTSHNYVNGDVSESTVDLAELSDDELDDYLFQFPEATSEVVFRELSRKISNNSK
jgi:hypothetical protein